MATKSAYGFPSDLPETEAGEKTGRVSAGTFVQITDIFGKTRARRVSLGRVWGLTVADAQRMVNQARADNAGLPVSASFTVDL
jgi:hypothetical protein